MRQTKAEEEDYYTPKVRGTGQSAYNGTQPVQQSQFGVYDKIFHSRTQYYEKRTDDTQSRVNLVQTGIEDPDLEAS